MKQVGVLGAGTMGFGIAFHFALHGYPVAVYDITEEALQAGQQKFEQYYALFEETGYPMRVTKAQMQQQMTWTTDLHTFADRHVIIESVIEDLSVKQRIFAQLDAIASDDAIIASNTSSLQLSDIICDMKRLHNRVMLMHFFNPAQIVPLVELLTLPTTDADVLQTAKQLLEDVHKTPVVIKKELPGLAANRIQVALAREALSLLEDGVISKEDLEKVIYDGPGFRYATSGLLKIIDFGGLDVWEKVLHNLTKEIDSSTRTFDVMQQLVNEKAYGVKTGKGFFEYPGKGFDELVMQRDQELIQHLLTTHYNEVKK